MKRKKNLKNEKDDRLTFWECIKVILVLVVTIAVIGLPIYLLKIFLAIKINWVLWYLIIAFIAYKMGLFKSYDYNENSDDDDDSYTDYDSDQDSCNSNNCDLE